MREKIIEWGPAIGSLLSIGMIGTLVAMAIKKMLRRRKFRTALKGMIV